MDRPGASEDTGASELGRRELVDLARLADGSLAPAQRAEVEARIAATPGGPELLAGERRAVDVVRTAAGAVRAPAQLRERIAAEGARARRPAARRRVALGGSLAVGLAILVLALVLVLPGGSPGGPSVSQAAALGARGPTAPAPPARPGHAALLARDVDEIYFPTWRGLGWQATGERVDRLDGRLLDTVYYRSGGWTIAYTIVAGPALAQPARPWLTVQAGTELRRLGRSGRSIVTWRRDGHTCILSGTRASERALLGLATGKVFH